MSMKVEIGKRPVFCRGGGRRGARILGSFPSCTRALRTRVGTHSSQGLGCVRMWASESWKKNLRYRVFNFCRAIPLPCIVSEHRDRCRTQTIRRRTSAAWSCVACLRRFVHFGLKITPKGSGGNSAEPPMEHAFLPDDGGFECIFCGRTASEHQKASGGSYESTKPAERDLEMEDEDDWDAIQEELRRLTRRCRQARAAARSSQPTHPRASPAWLSRLRKRRPERRPSCSSQK